MQHEAQAPKRRAADVIDAIERAIAEHTQPREAIDAVITAMLPEAERDLVTRAREQVADPRTDSEFELMRDVVARIVRDSGFTAPELLWYRINDIGNVVLRQVEIAAIATGEVRS